jgi:hypothetical protein
MLSVITIFNRPLDFPDSYVARRFTIGEGVSFPTSDYQISPSIEPLRQWADKQCVRFNGCGGVNMGRQSNDEPHVVESWV